MHPAPEQSCAPRVGLAWTGAADWLRAAGPLFAAGRVDVLEWSFDAETPRFEGAEELLAHFASHDALLGHGVSYSVLGAAAGPRREAWLRGLEAALGRHPMRWVSEHFGCMGAGSFDFASPLPVPRTAATVRIGQARLRELARVSARPVGLENLAFAFGPHDVEHEGEFLRELLGPVDGFVLLDLHNLYCRAHNFGIPADELLESYPLELVRELHVSGGSWSASEAEPGVRVRRDTHDHAVPEPVFRLLERALARCPALEFVLLERLGDTLRTPADEVEFRADFARLEALVTQVRHAD